MADGVEWVVGNGLVRAAEMARAAAERGEIQRAANGLLYANLGETGVSEADLKRVVGAVPEPVARALGEVTFFFVPLSMAEARTHRGSTDEETLVAPVYTAELAEEAVCHRNVPLADGHEGVFISARLLADTFAIAFELLINVAHLFTDRTGLPAEIADLLTAQAIAGVRGETSQDAHEARELAWHDRGRPGQSPSRQPDEKARTEYLRYAYSDALAIYQLSLAVDFDYSDLREREYPLLAPSALAERLRLAAKLFPPNPGYEFAIRYRRRA